MSTVKLTPAELEAIVEMGVKEYLRDIKNGKIKRQDYFTATDIEGYVRYTIDKAAGHIQSSVGWDTPYFYYDSHSGIRISVMQQHGYKSPLLSCVRSALYELVRIGEIEGHNFGRGHCSGMRFRGAGKVMSDTERATMEAKEKKRNKPPIYHSVSHYEFRGETRVSNLPLCTQKQRQAKRGYPRSRSTARTTTDVARVNCPRCLKLIRTQSMSMPTVE